jgi:hypothetical protein
MDGKQGKSVDLIMGLTQWGHRVRLNNLIKRAWVHACGDECTKSLIVKQYLELAGHIWVLLTLPG